MATTTNIGIWDKRGKSQVLLKSITKSNMKELIKPPIFPLTLNEIYLPDC